MVEVLVLTVDALQPAVAFTVRVDAVSQPSADLLEGRGLPVRLVPREAFKFRVIRVEGNDLLLADLTAVLDHLLNEQGQFLQERLVAVDDLEKLSLQQDVVVELLQTVLEVLVQAVDAGRIEGTPLLLVSDVLDAETPVMEVSRVLPCQFLMLSVEGADGHEPKAATV